MNKIIFALALFTFILASCTDNKSSSEKRKDENTPAKKEAMKPMSLEDKIKNQTYQIEKEKLPMKNGSYAGEHNKYSIVKYDTGDVNKDGIDDLFAVLISESSGTGVFYHANLLLGQSDGSFKFAAEHFLGDRIKFDYVEIIKPGSKIHGLDVAHHKDDYGKMGIAYYGRNDKQSFADEPKIHVTPSWRYEGGKMILQDQN